MKKAMALVLVCMLMLSLLAACGGGGSSASTAPPAEPAESAPASSGEDAAPDGEAVELTMWALQTTQTHFEPLTAEFNEANPDINVTISFYQTDPIKEASKVAASSGTLPSMWFNFGGSLGSFYVENGLTYDLTEFAAANGWSDIFTPAVLELCTLDGQLAGYPSGYNVIGVFYHKDIFEQYGLEVPNTLEEFEQVCDTLIENGITPISTGGLYGWHVMRTVEQLIEHYAGPELHDQLSTFQASHNNEAVIQAFAKYQEWAQKGYFPEGFVTIDPEDTMVPFYGGACAMIFEGQWYDNNLVNDGQNLDDYGIFAFPSGDKHRMAVFGDMFQFNADLSEAEVAAGVKYLDFLFSDDAVSRYSDQYGTLPRIGASMPEGRPNTAEGYALADQNGIFTITDQAFPTEIADALFNVQAALGNNEMTPEEGAAELQAAIDAYNG